MPAEEGVSGKPPDPGPTQPVSADTPDDEQSEDSFHETSEDQTAPSAGKPDVLESKPVTPPVAVKEGDDQKENLEEEKHGHGPVTEVEDASSETPQPTKPTLRTDVKADSSVEVTPEANQSANTNPKSPQSVTSPHSASHHTHSRTPSKPVISEWSHQQLAAPSQDEAEPEVEQEWQEMPAYAEHTLYDDETGKIIANEFSEENAEVMGYATLGGAKGYTRVQLDEDAQSATSMDEDTAYLFKDQTGFSGAYEDEDDMRDALAQLKATKDLLTEGQRIAYVGAVRLAIVDLQDELSKLEKTKGTKKQLELAAEAIKMWGQKIMVRLYGHMEIDTAEQVMIEQLAEHGLQASDLVPTLMVNARVKNPQFNENEEEPIEESELSKAEETEQSTSPNDVVETPEIDAPKTDVVSEEQVSRKADIDGSAGGIAGVAKEATDQKGVPNDDTLTTRSSIESEPPPPYQRDIQDFEEEVKSPLDLKTEKIDIDIRWTVLCDLFLVLISDQTYDSRSRTLLERVGKYLEVPWVDICRFEKRITDALEMEEEVNQENWDEKSHMEKRRLQARKKRLMMMGLATVGGGLVIGLSAGLLAPMIGAGLVAGFSAIGVAAPSAFITGAGGMAIVTTTGIVTGSTIGVRASSRRSGAVKTFEYRPLHNSKRVNLIVTVAGWMTGKIDDVRLPFSTVSPIMGDIYSLYWEPEMLRSMGDTINILATEALTQGLQQVLGSTILISLMAAIQLPIVLTKLSYLIDNPWSVSLARADQAGLILADSLMERNLGRRPVTLVGFSIGSRVIFSALKELAKRGALGLVENVYMLGSPVVINKDDFLRARSIVSGRFLNAYTTNDWILGYLFRATGGGILPVAGLSKIDIPGIENHDVTEIVPGHMSYRTAIPKILKKVGWIVDNEEFAEIEDPDPDAHEKRQRELINEIEEARKELEQKPGKKRFGLFGTNKKKLEKKAWEVYDERLKGIPEQEGAEGAQANGIPGGLLFDVDAIAAEIAEFAAQGFQVKQLETTLPPMKLNSPYLTNGEPASQSAPHLTPPTAFGREASPSPHRNARHSQSRERGSFDSHASYNMSTTNASNYTVSRDVSPAPPYENHTTSYNSARDTHSDVDESRISMTFEPVERAHSTPHPYPYPSGEDTIQMRFDSSSHDITDRDSSDITNSSTHRDAHDAPQRPPLQPANSTPTLSTRFDRNVWADEEDEFGQDKEVQMTFE